MSIASVAVATAVSKPKVTTVAARSLSMVFGTPMMGMPFCARPLAIFSEPSPPMAMSPSKRRRRKVSTAWSETST